MPDKTRVFISNRNKINIHIFNTKESVQYIDLLTPTSTLIFAYDGPPMLDITLAKAATLPPAFFFVCTICFFKFRLSSNKIPRYLTCFWGVICKPLRLKVLPSLRVFHLKKMVSVLWGASVRWFSRIQFSIIGIEMFSLRNILHKLPFIRLSKFQNISIDPLADEYW